MPLLLRLLSWMVRLGTTVGTLTLGLWVVALLTRHDLLHTGEQQRGIGLALCAASLWLSRSSRPTLARPVARALAVCGQALLLLGVVDVAPHVIWSLSLAGAALGLGFAALSADPFERGLGAAGAAISLFAIASRFGTFPVACAVGLAWVGVAGLARDGRRSWAAGAGLGTLVALSLWPAALGGVGALCLGASVLSAFGPRAWPWALAAAALSQLPAGAWIACGVFALWVGGEQEVPELSILGGVAVALGGGALQQLVPGPRWLPLLAVAVLGLPLPAALRYWRHGRDPHGGAALGRAPGGVGGEPAGQGQPVG